MNSKESAIAVREAQPGDLAIILAFIRKKAVFDGVPEWVEATEETLRIHLFSARPSAYVLLAELEGRAVGFAIYFLTFSSFISRPGIWLDDLYVDGDARGRGVGGALLTHLAKIADARGYGRIEWVTAVHNLAGLNFYRRNGAQMQEAVRLLRLGRPELSHLAQHGAV